MCLEMTLNTLNESLQHAPEAYKAEIQREIDAVMEEIQKHWWTTFSIRELSTLFLARPSFKIGLPPTVSLFPFELRAHGMPIVDP